MKRKLWFCIEGFFCFTCLVFPATGVSALAEKAGDEKMVSSAELNVDKLLARSCAAGGIVVHVGCGTGEGSAALAENSEPFIVQGLDADEDELERAWQLARKLGLAGRLSFKRWNGGRLPYADNLVNVVFWEKPDERPDMEEIMRVLVPHGTAYFRQDEEWRRVRKPWPDDIDEWSHYRYDAGNTGASKDARVGPPTQLQWEAGPRFMRNHEMGDSGLHSLLSTNGKIYYIIDEGPLGIVDKRFPPKWSLICRDAFNGIVLWKRNIGEWGWQARGEAFTNDPESWMWLKGNRDGTPALVDIDRRMVADGETLYVTLGWGEPISALDGSTGEVRRSYQETAGVNEFIVLDDVLVARTDTPGPSITAVQAEDGQILWRREFPLIMDRSLAAVGDRVFVHTRTEMVSLDLRTGKEIWRIETGLRPRTVIAHQNAVLVVQPSATLALATETGEKLWMKDPPGSLWSVWGGLYPDVFVTDERVWWNRREGLDIKTGEEIQRLELQRLLQSGHHRRCYTDRITSSYWITGQRGSEFLDLRQDDHKRHNWFRGPCVHGMTPANGLFYVPPHECFCYPAVRMDGFFALASQGSGNGGGDGDVDPPRLEKGPAYGGPAPEACEAASREWPTYRQDVLRSGSTPSQAPAELSRLWKRALGEGLTQPVAAGGRVFVAQEEAGTLHCLDADNGEILWSRSVTGPIDSPPTIYRGHALLGSRDGYVYSFRARDGELAWRFRAAPEAHQIVSHERLESPWPVHGSVLILDDLVYFSAGRSGFIDGGIYLYAVRHDTGEPVYAAQLEGPSPDISRGSYAFHKEGYRSDLLTSDGQYVYMGRLVLDRTLQVVQPEIIRGARGHMEYRVMPGMRLVATGGFMDRTFYNRTWWMHSRLWPGMYLCQQAPKSGQMLVFDELHTYTVKHYTTRNWLSPMFFPGNGYLLFADDNENEPLLYSGEGEPAPMEWEPAMPVRRLDMNEDALANHRGIGFTRAHPPRWTRWVDVRVEAMVVAGTKLIIAGSPDLIPKDDPLAALEGRMGGILKVVSTEHGKTMSRYSLESKPVFDGLIVTDGRLYFSTQQGEVVCMGQ